MSTPTSTRAPIGWRPGLLRDRAAGTLLAVAVGSALIEAFALVGRYPLLRDYSTPRLELGAPRLGEHQQAWVVGAGLALVYAVVSRLRPEHTVRALILYGWSPLLQFEFAGNGHNDAVAVFCMLLALLFFLRRRHALAVLAITAGVLVKFVPVLILPILIAGVAKDPRLAPRSRAIAIGTGGILSLLLVALAYVPYGLGSIPQSLLQLGQRENRVGSSLAAFVVPLLNGVLGTPRATVLSAFGTVTK